MKKFVLVLASSLFAANLAVAQAPAAAPQSDCEAKAVSKAGKPLVGAAKASSLKKCMGEAKAEPTCEEKAVGKNGKPLAGAAKASFMKKCEADAKK